MTKEVTYVAPGKRATERELGAEIEIVSKNPVLSGLLHSVSGLLAVLNEKRQLVALNDSFMQTLGIENPEETFGLRHGEALRCIHSDGEPDGCGTTEYCSTCGAAVAIVACIADDEPAERICALTVNRDDKTVDIALLVKSQSILIDERRFLLLFLQDITKSQHRAALERTFYHDVNNMLSMLVGASDLLLEEDPSDLAKTINQASLRLKTEVAVQSRLSQGESGNYKPMYSVITTEQILKLLRTSFATHPVARNRNLEISIPNPIVSFKTDISLLSRVLCNMITNALEATEEDGNVKVWAEHSDNVLSFCVWNKLVIPPDIALRIFQRNFSTKKEAGRGIGTYSMKLFGEKILGGSVSFISSQEEGTVFKIALQS